MRTLLNLGIHNKLVDLSRSSIHQDLWDFGEKNGKKVDAAFQI